MANGIKRPGPVERNGQLYDGETGRWLGQATEADDEAAVEDAPVADPTTPVADEDETIVVKPYSEMTKKELKALLDGAEISYKSNAKAGELIALAEAHIG